MSIETTRPIPETGLDQEPAAGSALAAHSARAARANRNQVWRRFARYKPGVFGLAFILVLIVCAVAAPLIAPHDPYEIHMKLRGHAPSREYLLGNDSIGRDIFSRLIYGTRVALIVGIGATAIAVTIGVTIGAIAGYFGGTVDFVLSRFVDALMAFPLLALLLTLSAVFGPSLRNAVIVIGCSIWASYARIVRAEVLSLREFDYVLAARAAGASDRRIIARHIVPNALGPVIVLASLAIGGVIILESALSFLGLGVRPPTASWGAMLADGREFLRRYPHIAIAPGLSIAVTVLAFNLVGDGLRDALDPRGTD